MTTMEKIKKDSILDYTLLKIVAALHLNERKIKELKENLGLLLVDEKPNAIAERTLN